MLAWRPLGIFGDVTASQKIILHAVLSALCTQWTRGENSYHIMGTRRRAVKRQGAPRGGGGGRGRSSGFEQTCRNIPTTFHTIFNYSGQMGFGEDFLKLWRFLHIYFYVKTILKLNPPCGPIIPPGIMICTKLNRQFLFYIFLYYRRISSAHIQNKHMRVDQIKVMDPTRRNKLLQNIFVIVKHLNESCPLCR